MSQLTFTPDCANTILMTGLPIPLPTQCIFKHEAPRDSSDFVPPDIPDTLWSQGDQDKQ